MAQVRKDMAMLDSKLIQVTVLFFAAIAIVFAVGVTHSQRGRQPIPKSPNSLADGGKLPSPIIPSH